MCNLKLFIISGPMVTMRIAEVRAFVLLATELLGISLPEIVDTDTENDNDDE